MSKKEELDIGPIPKLALESIREAYGNGVVEVLGSAQGSLRDLTVDALKDAHKYMDYVKRRRLESN